MAKEKSMLPEPRGYRVLIAIPAAEKKVGSVYIPDSLQDREHTASICGSVIAMGEDAYKDPNKFPTGPWCKVGDWIMFRSYSGTRFKMEDCEFRLINDDTVEAVVADPRLITRA